MSCKNLIKRVVSFWITTCNKNRAKAFYKNAIKYNPRLAEHADGEEEWLKRWRKYDKHLTPLAYRVFSRYVGNNKDIVPLEICSGFIEPVLTPYHFSGFYGDKNSLDILFSDRVLPPTLLRNIRGNFYNRDYVAVSGSDVNTLLLDVKSDKMVVKPSLGDSGRGVQLFVKKDAAFVNDKGEQLSADYLKKTYKKDYIVQEAFRQSAFFSQFNPSSVNTIRIATYRDQKGTIHSLKSIIRIGANGSFVDNAHAGGAFVGVMDRGELGSYVCDQFGRTSVVFNGVDFSSNQFVIPEWDKIKAFVCELGKKVIHHDLLAWDVAVDEAGVPHILEVNVGGFGGWPFQFTSGPMFGKCLDDVLEKADKRNKSTELKISFSRK